MSLPYDLKVTPIKAFAEDNTIRFPRFQRNRTWTAEQNFRLVMSIFKGYPAGAVVVREEGSGKDLVKLLLDGRQRRHAFKEMTNPENVYRWGRRTLGIRAGMAEDDLRELFRSYVQGFFGEEILEPSPTPSVDTVEAISSDDENPVAPENESGETEAPG